MDQRFWKMVAGTTVVVLLVLALAAVSFIYSGVYDVAASEDHATLVRWALNTTQERSIKARGDEIPAPPPMDSSLVSHGFEHFRQMCVVCHGAPGVDRGELGQGLNPTPPELSEAADAFTDAELFWITKHGIKFTGMPAFGPTHSDEEIWGIAAFVRRLTGMSPEEYGRLVSAAEGSPARSGAHAHAPGTSNHSH